MDERTKRLMSVFDDIMFEQFRLYQENKRLREENQLLRQQITHKRKKGRQNTYDIAFRERVVAYYTKGHTYTETAKEFNICKDTVRIFLKQTDK